jgi:predicted CopG family antitoxin
MKRMHVTLDEDALEDARRLTGKKSYSDTINHLVAQAVNQDRLMKAIDDLSKDPDPWWPGYVEEMAPDVSEYLKNKDKKKPRRRTAANTVRAPKEKRAKLRGSR